MQRALTFTLFCMFPLYSLAAQPVTVASRPLAELAIYPSRDAQAQVLSLNIAKLSAQISARIDSIAVEPGQRIAKNAVVARLDCRDYALTAQRAEAALESAQARLQLAQQQLRRGQELAAKNFISGDALDAKKTDVAVAASELKLNAAQLATTRRDIEKCTLRTPYPAIVEARLAQVGELAAPGTPIAQLWDTSRLQVSAQVQEADADTLTKVKSPVFVSQGREYGLKLLRISPAMGLASRTREARFTFVKDMPAPGSNGVVRWRDPRPHLAAEYLVNRGGIPGLFVLNGQTAHFVPLAGAQEGRPAVAPLPLESRIVTQGRSALQDGMAVRAAQ
jgi:RND family efflux transporter MFP subunit